jgi:hypothetical protein
MNLILKNYKPAHNLSEETLAFTATLYIDGKRAATVSNHGRGGCNDYDFEDRELEKAFYAHCDTILFDTADEEKEWLRSLHGKPKGADSVIGDLCDELEHKKWVKSQTRNGVLFRLEGAREGEYKVVKFRKGLPKATERAAAKAWIAEKYGDQVIEVLA